ncbi:MAG: U32 family peptidase, partial [Deltaproteobacteria bacterium]|nr:U32 family peptidase [Deltaproteobacteria bacterium]
MKISAPLSSPDEVEMLVRSGAQELYAGILPSAWSRQFGARAPLSRRHSANANLGTLEELERAVSKAHTLGARFFLALNAPHYSAEQCAAIVRLAGECARAGVDAFIVADLALLLSLRRAELGVALHLSSLGRAQNRAAIGFFAGLGVSRVILSRQVTLAEIAATVSAHEGLEIEAFVLNDGCVFEESLCATTHARGAFCFTPWRFRARSSRSVPRLAPAPAPGTSPASPPTDAAWEAHLQDYDRWRHYQDNAGCSYGPRG